MIAQNQKTSALLLKCYDIVVQLQSSIDTTDK